MLLYLYSNIPFQVMVFEHTEDITFSRRFYLNQKLKLKKRVNYTNEVFPRCELAW